jgi:hypothetical protein
MNGPLAVASQSLTMALCLVVWMIMALLPMAIYRLARSSLRKWLALILLNAALWFMWITQYRLIAANPPWATTGVRFWLLLVESAGCAIILFSLMYRERARVRSRNLARLEWDG